MDLEWLDIALITGACLGLFAVLAYISLKLSHARQRYQHALQEIAVLELHAQEAESLRHTNSHLRTELQSLHVQLAETKKEQQMQTVAHEEKLRLMENAKQQFMQAFEALSAQALEKSNRSFLNLAHETLAKFHEAARGDLKLRQQAVGEMVSPIRQALTEVDTKLQALEKERIAW